MASLWLKSAVTLFVFVFLFIKIDVASALRALSKVNYLSVLLALGLYLFCQILSAYRWRLLVRVVGFRNSLKDLVAYYFVGMFFSLFLPGIVGGDMGRAYFLSKSKGSLLTAFYSTFAERFIGVLALLAIATFSFLFFSVDLVPSPIQWLTILLTAFLFFFTPLAPQLARFLSKLYKRINSHYLKDLYNYWKNPRKVILALVFSFIIQLIVISIHILIGHSLNLSLPLRYYFAFVPLVGLVSALPISLNGMGIREGSYIYFLTLAGIKSNVSLTFGLFWLLIILVSGLIGGMVYLSGDFALSTPRSLIKKGLNRKDEIY